MSLCNESRFDSRPVARQLVRRTRDAWLAGDASPARMNGIAATETKRMTAGSPVGCGRDETSRCRRRAWVSIALAVIAVVSVVAVELWAARGAPGLGHGAAREVAEDVGTTVARVTASSLLMAPID
jgi:hypothetical protein